MSSSSWKIFAAITIIAVTINNQTASSQEISSDFEYWGFYSKTQLEPYVFKHAFIKTTDTVTDTTIVARCSYSQFKQKSIPNIVNFELILSRNNFFRQESCAFNERKDTLITCGPAKIKLNGCEESNIFTSFDPRQTAETISDIEFSIRDTLNEIANFPEVCTGTLNGKPFSIPQKGARRAIKSLLSECDKMFGRN